MSTISSQEVISIVKGEIEDYDAHAGRIRESGWEMELPLYMESITLCMERL